MLCDNTPKSDPSRHGGSRLTVGSLMTYNDPIWSTGGGASFSTARRSLIRAAAGALVGTAVVPVGLGAAEPRESGSRVTFRGCRVAFVDDASAVNAIEATHVDVEESTHVNRVEDPDHERPRRIGQLQVEYDGGHDRTQLQLVGAERSMVYLELMTDGGNEGWLNPHERCVPEGFSLTDVPSDQVAKLLADDGSAEDRFGCSVDIDGDIAIVGAIGSDAGGRDSGMAYVCWPDDEGHWSGQSPLVPEGLEAAVKFGRSVAVDGGTGVVGVPLDGIMNPGAAHVFQPDGSGGWEEVVKLKAGDGSTSDRLGTSVDIAGDTIVAGAPLAGGSGAVYVFGRDSAGTWTERAKLTADTATSTEKFGQAVGTTGETVVIGAPKSDGVESDEGAGYVFVGDGGTWAEEAKLTADDGGATAEFGAAVAVETSTAVLGDPFADDVGAAYVFDRDEDGSWTKSHKLAPADARECDDFGASVALDGDVIMVGAPGRDDRATDAGAVHVYTRDASGSWAEYTQLTASEPDDPTEPAGDAFGGAVGIGGGRAVVGAPHDDELEATAGAAFVFE